MKDSGIDWIGLIPKEWQIKKVNKVFYRRKEVNCEENPVILSLARDGVKIRDITTNEGQLAKNYSEYHRVYKGDLMLNPMDLISGANCSLSNVEGVISPAYINLAIKVDSCSKFYDYFFKNQYWVKAMFVHGKGVSFDNRWTLNYETIMNYEIPFPKLEEQKKLVYFLDDKIIKIEQTIDDNKKIIELLKEYQESFIRETILGNDKESCVDLYKQWITKVEKNTEIIPIKFMSNIQTGTTPKGYEQNNDIKKIEWFTPGDFKEIKLNKSNRKLDESLVEYNKLYKDGSTLIIGIGGTLGKVGYIEGRGYSNQQITAIIPNEKLVSKYLTYNVIAAKEYIKDTTPYTTLPILSNVYLQKILLCYRSYKMQIEIVKKIDDILEKVDNIILYRKQIIEKLEEYKKSLIYEVVTGKKEV